MGSIWKMPTKTQAQELINGTNSTWTTINGVNGRKFTSKTDSSKYIFLPAGGYWTNTTFNYAASYGWYWSTTNSYVSGAAYILSSFNAGLNTSNCNRYIGDSIRPVQ